MGRLEVGIAPDSEEKRWSLNQLFLKLSLNVKVILNPTLSLVFEICNQGWKCSVLLSLLSLRSHLPPKENMSRRTITEVVVNFGEMFWLWPATGYNTRYRGINPLLLALEILTDLNPKWKNERYFWHGWGATWGLQTNLMLDLRYILKALKDVLKPGIQSLA